MNKYKLGEIAEIIGGVTYDKADLSASGIRILRGGNIQNGEVCLKEDDVFLPYFYKDDKNTVQVGDTILVASTGSVEVLGKAATTFSSLGDVQIGAFLRIIRPKEDKYAAIISAYLQSTLFRMYIQKQAKGTSINNIRNEHLANFTLYIPFDNNLVLFSSFYCNLDRKITLNRSINHNLEAMVKQLYNYWFVQFDFPDENGKPYKSSGGKMVWNEKLKREVPVLWESKLVDDVAEVFNGATPSTANEQNYGGNVVWITPKDLSDQQQKFVYYGKRNISHIGYDSCSTHLLPINTILMSSRAPIGLLSIAKTYLCTNQGFKNFVSKEENMATYLYYYLKIHIKQIEQLGTGTTFKEVSREDVLKFPILKPNNETLCLWETNVATINDKQLEIQKENENLTKLRDLLLPLLMNGQVSINYDLSTD